jgi:hypothetical protein
MIFYLSLELNSSFNSHIANSFMAYFIIFIPPQEFKLLYEVFESPIISQFFILGITTRLLQKKKYQVIYLTHSFFLFIYLNLSLLILFISIIFIC